MTMRSPSTALLALLALLAPFASGGCGEGAVDDASDGALGDDGGDDGGLIPDATRDGDSSVRDGAVDASDGVVAPPAPGLLAEYYDAYLDLVVSRVEPTLDHDWGDAAPVTGAGPDRFSARWTGFLVPPVSGSFKLVTENDDGIRVWIGDKRVIDDWQGHFVTRNEATITLEKDVPISIRVEYFELDLKASARLLWSAAGIPEQIIPKERLRAATVASALGGPKPPFTNPVMAFDCPDPGVVATAGPTYFAVCTGGSFPIRSSRSLVTWSTTGSSILPAGKPAWSANGKRNWAPEIHRVGAGFVAYFTTVDGADVLSIGAATAKDPKGPFTDIGHALVTHPDGVIDATFFEDDDGSRWLLYKIDGNAHGRPTPIFVRRLADDGISFAAGSTAKQVLVNDLAWEGGVVEAPWVVKHAGTYYVFYSGNVYDSRYRTGVARATKLDDPSTYVKHGAPILVNNGTWEGPGHGSVVAVGALDYFVYHAWPAGSTTQRQVLVDRIVWEAGWPKIADGTPSHAPQPWPGLLE